MVELPPDLPQWLALGGGLSAYELRYHHVCYRLLRGHVAGRHDLNLYMWAHGVGTQDLGLFLDPACRLDLAGIEVALPERSALIYRTGRGQRVST
jgi:hypothetical protein